mmetsp:Transcript_38168/g.28119  ORF Transcript_38168/g.28119 Transcript_38168/m.28119 type:complete len:177 (-) Transcript_38168:38-568(-)
MSFEFSKSMETQNLTNDETILILDNTPFPTGIIPNYQPLYFYIMKENTFNTSEIYYTATYALILVACMLFVIFIGLLSKYLLILKGFKKDALNLKTAILEDANKQNLDKLGAELLNPNLETEARGTEQTRNSQPLSSIREPWKYLSTPSKKEPNSNRTSVNNDSGGGSGSSEEHRS